MNNIKKIGMTGVFVVSSFFIVLLENSFAQDVTQRIQNGTINWSNLDRTITVAGKGAPPPDCVTGKNPNTTQCDMMTERAAQVDARANLLAVIESVSITSDTIVKNGIVEGTIIRKKYKGILRNSYVTEGERLPNGGMRAIASIGGNAIFQGVIQDIERSENANNMLAPNPTFSTNQSASPGNNPITGVIINAAGLNTRPVMIPKIIAGDNHEVFGHQVGDRTTCQQNQYADYTASLDDARRREKAGSNPLVINATKTSGSGRGDVIVKNDDAVKLYTANLNHQILRDCRVVFVLGKSQVD